MSNCQRIDLEEIRAKGDDDRVPDHPHRHRDPHPRDPMTRDMAVKGKKLLTDGSRETDQAALANE